LAAELAAYICKLDSDDEEDCAQELLEPFPYNGHELDHIDNQIEPRENLMPYRYAIGWGGRCTSLHVSTCNRKISLRKLFSSVMPFVVGFLFGLAILTITGYISKYTSPLFFPYQLVHGEMILYSDTPIPDSYVLLTKTTTEMLSKSPYYNGRLPLRIYLCDTRWRFSLFSYFSSNRIGYYNVDSDSIFIDHQKMDSARELMEVMVHEATHAMVFNSLGKIKMWLLPKWVSEGYAEYVAYPRMNKLSMSFKVLCLNRMEARRSAKSYQRYHVLVAYALDVKKIPLETLMRNPPLQRDLERELGLRNRSYFF
jgi:hypothetical protein